MARLAAQAELGFVPTPIAIEDALVSYVAAPDRFVGRIIDPCAGEGIMIAAWARRFGLAPSQVYANELHDGRAERCRKRSEHVLECDALKSLQGTANVAQFAWLNPPFDHDGLEEGGGRLEPKYFRRVVEEGKWIQPGGVVALMTPQDILARPECRNHIARSYDDVSIWALPDEHRRYREAVVFGVVRASSRIGREQKDEAERLGTMLHGMLPLLVVQPMPLYHLPLPRPIRKIVWRDASRGNTVIAQNDVVRSGGAWTSKRYRSAAHAMDRTTPVPLFPLTKAQAALRIADGLINGETVDLDGRMVEIKGATVEEEQTWVEEKDTGKAHIVETHRIVRRAPHVTTIDHAGRIGRYIGDKGIATLMETPGAAEVLLGAVKRKAPPLYQLDMTPDVAAILRALRPRSGRALPGYAPGLLAMQQHVVAAAHRALTTYNPAHGRVPSSVLINAEMGVGKSSCSIALAELLRLLAPTDGVRSKRRR
jgi:hypothetical protein